MGKIFELPPHTKAEVEKAFPAAKRIARYIHQHQMDYVLVPGTGAQVAAYMVKIAWKSDPKLKHIPLPVFFALAKNNTQNPDASLRDLEQTELVQLIKSRMVKHSKGIESKNIFILEDCVHTGETIHKIKKALRSIGINKIRAGTMTYLYSSSYAPMQVDIAGIERHCPDYQSARKIMTLSYQSSRSVLKDLERIGLPKESGRSVLLGVRKTTLMQVRALRKEIRKQARRK